MTAPKSVRVPLRLPAGFHAEATAYAEAIGLSLNALCAIALRQFLDRAKDGGESMHAMSILRTEPRAASGSGGPRPAVVPPAPRSIPKVAKGQPCPCGSGKPYGKCHGRQL